ncbi:outer membrane protein assembly factor BamB [Gammaproteobacteria bacterium]|nr:outer membrane protein assembly factor BamB [Gammaproteobacteria bacterium]MDC3225472.1 outer membrane protein assembly factor BamB [Gammaproteobacteria bacterium]
MVIFTASLLSSCSSLSSLQFWQGEKDEYELDEPRKLENISNNKKIITNWDISFTGENLLGNFIPSFAGDSIYFADSSGNIKSINSISGSINWKKEVSLLSTGISAGFGILIVADIDGNVIALDQNNGTELWTSNVKGEVLAPAAVDAKFIIVKTGSGELIALNKDSGEIEWSYRSKLPALTIRGSSSPVIDNNMVYATFDNGRLGVFELESGYPVWDGAISYVSGSSELENLIDSDSSPVIEGGLVFTTSYQGNINIFDIAQKRSVWQSESSSFYSPLLLRGLIILVEANSNLKTFFSKNLEKSWSSNEYLNRSLSNPSSFNGFLLVGDFEGYIHIIDPLNGQTVARKKISRKPIMKLISRSNNFYAIDEDFNLFSLSI